MDEIITYQLFQYKSSQFLYDKNSMLPQVIQF